MVVDLLVDDGDADGPFRHHVKPGEKPDRPAGGGSGRGPRLFPIGETFPSAYPFDYVAVEEMLAAEGCCRASRSPRAP